MASDPGTVVRQAREVIGYKCSTKMIFKCTEFGVDFRFSGSARILAGCTSDFRRAQRAGNFFGVVFINTGGVVYVCEMTCVIYLPHIVLGIGLRVGACMRNGPDTHARAAREEKFLGAHTLGIRFSPRCTPADK